MKAILLLCTTALFVAACGAGTKEDAASTAGVAKTADGTHFVVAQEGRLLVKRQGWSKYVPAGFGTALRRGDLLRLESGQATVVCADLTVVSVQRAGGGVPCTGQEAALVYEKSKVNPTRSGSDTGAPVVLAPRGAKLLNPRPTLRWQPVDGASAYTVSVRGPNVDWSADVRGRTELPYPADKPALNPGGAYRITVVANRRSSDEAGPVAVTLVSAAEAEAVRASEQKIRALAISDEAKRFLVANLYASRGLHAEALEIVEPLARDGQSLAPMRLAGELSLETGLTHAAEEHYARALERARAAGDIWGQADAAGRLAAIYETLGNRDEAARHYEEAGRLYREIGDGATGKQMDESLKALRP